MFDIGWTELLLIGIVALIVVGPKDLPVMFHTLGRFTAKARSMAREFTRAMDDAAKESGVGDVAKDLKNLTSARNLGLDKVKDAASKFEKWDPMKPSKDPKGPATAALSEERAAAAEKIREASAKMASDRLAAEAAAKAGAENQKATRKSEPTAKPTPKPAAKAKAAAKPKTAAKPKAAAAAEKPVKKPAAGKAAKKATE
jgi:sec-independent protein translocase protein TatB